MPAPAFAAQLLGWKGSGKNKLGWPQVPNNADVDNRQSLQLAAAVLDQLGFPGPAVGTPPTDPGSQLEEAVLVDLGQQLAARDPSRLWSASRKALITDYSQYVHLKHLNALVQSNPTLSVTNRAGLPHQA
jgi:hypothetical protein